MKEKKTKKQTLTISTKKPFSVPDYPKNSQKKSFIIEKTSSRNKSDRRYVSRNDNVNKTSGSFKKEPLRQTNFKSANPLVNKNFEIRKKAEENAKKRFKSPSKPEDSIFKKNTLTKNKSNISKREVKLTISKALDEEALEGKGRSLASVRRARLKEKQNLNLEHEKSENKKIVHEVNIPSKCNN